MSFWGTLGKIALKVAPIAAAFIPGVGIPLAIAISGAASAASKKIEGGSWKDALVAGGIGAGAGAISGGALSGIGPTSSVLAKFAGGAAGKTAGTGAAGLAGSVLGNMGKSALTDAVTSSGGSGGGSVAPTDTAMPRPGGLGPSPATVGRQMPGQQRTVMPRGGYGFNQNPMNQLDQSNPNLAQSIFQGRQESMQNQPFRLGATVQYGTPPTDPNAAPDPTKFRTSQLPPIYPNLARRPRWNQQPQVATGG